MKVVHCVHVYGFTCIARNHIRLSHCRAKGAINASFACQFRSSAAIYVPSGTIFALYCFTGVFGKITQKANATTNAKPAKIYQLVRQPAHTSIGPAAITASAFTK